MIKKIIPKIVDLSKDEHWLCMCEDAKLLHNLIEQKTRIYRKDTDYIQPGLLSGQTLEGVLREIMKSINNHLDYFNENHICIF